MDLVNFHTHTSRCKHADGSDEDYVNVAIEQHFKVLGFSDHSPWHYDSGFIPRSRMEEHQLEDYVTSINNLKEKYKNQIEIKIGLEAEYFQDKMDWLIDKANYYNLDYLIFGNHFCPSDEYGYNFFANSNKDAIDQYLYNLELGLKSGVYSYLAHPEVFMRGYRVLDDYSLQAFDTIAKLCKKYNTPVEYNLTGKSSDLAMGTQTYPHIKFWQIAGQYKLDALVGFDAHYPLALKDWQGLYKEGLDIINQVGCNLIDKIEYQKWK